MNNLNLISLYIASFAGFSFFLYSYFSCQTIPKFNQVAMVVLAWIGAVAGFHLGYVALIEDDKFLGSLADQRVAILLGALAVIWTSAESFFASVKAVQAFNNSSQP